MSAENPADRKIEAKIAQLMAETMKIDTEAMKIGIGPRWYPFIAGAGAALSGACTELIELFAAQSDRLKKKPDHPGFLLDRWEARS